MLRTRLLGSIQARNGSRPRCRAARGGGDTPKSPGKPIRSKLIEPSRTLVSLAGSNHRSHPFSKTFLNVIMDQPQLTPSLGHLSEPGIILDRDFLCVWESFRYCVKTLCSPVNRGEGAHQGHTTRLTGGC